MGNTVENTGKTLLHGSLVAFSMRAAGAVLVLVMQLVLARLLGADEYGIYIYSITWIILLAQFSCLGFDTSLVRYLPVYRQHQEWQNFRGLLRISFTCTGITSLLIIALAAFVIHQAGIGFPHPLWIGLLLLPVLSISIIRQTVLRSLKNIAQSQLPEFIVRPVLVITLSFACILLANAPLTANDSLSIYLVASIVALAIGTSMMRRSLPAAVRVTDPAYKTYEWIKTSIPLLFVSGMILIMSRIDVIMIGMIKTPEETGIYAAASQLAELMTFALIAANTIAGPLISEIHSSRDTARLQRTAVLATRIASTFAILFVLFIIIAGDTLLGLYGERFTQGYPVLLVLACGQMVNIFSGSVGLILGMTGHQRAAARIAGISATVNILLNLYLIPRYGTMGAAVSTAVSIALWNLWMLYEVNRKVHVNPSIIGRAT